MRRTAPYLLFALALLALATAPAFAGCGQSCGFKNCIPDEPTIGCVEDFGFCWEVPCFAAADSEGCRVDKALTEAFASFEADLTGEEALERLRADETFAAEILPFLRVVGENGEVFRGEKYLRRPDVKLAQEGSEKAEDDRAAER